MKYLILVVWAVVVVACGATAVDDSTAPPIVEEGGDPVTEFRSPDPGIPEEPPSFTLLRSELSEAQRRWVSVDRPWYRYLVQTSCECHPIDVGPSQVVVVGGSVTEVWYEGPFEVERPHALERTRGFTAEELFARIDRAIAQGTPSDVSYYDNGMPKKVYLDLDGIAADGGFAITIDGYEDPVDDLAELADARARWEAAGIESYSFDYSSGTMALSEYSVTVSGSTVVVDGTTFAGDPTTVEELFDMIEAILADEPDLFAAAYDETTGFPIGINVDRWFETIDDEMAATIAWRELG